MKKRFFSIGELEQRRSTLGSALARSPPSSDAAALRQLLKCKISRTLSWTNASGAVSPPRGRCSSEPTRCAGGGTTGGKRRGGHRKRCAGEQYAADAGAERGGGAGRRRGAPEHTSKHSRSSRRAGGEWGRGDEKRGRDAGTGTGWTHAGSSAHERTAPRTPEGRTAMSMLAGSE